MTTLAVGMQAVIPGIRGGHIIVEIGPVLFDDGTPLIHLQNNRTGVSAYRHLHQIIVVHREKQS